MARPNSSLDRTLTAMLSPFADADKATTALLLGTARAGAATWTADDRVVVLGKQLELGRRAGGGVELGIWGLDDALVSTRHARISMTERGFVIEDLASKNGTFVEGGRLTVAQVLCDGDRVFVGGHGFVFRMVSAAALDAIQAELKAPLAPVPSVSPLLATLAHKLRRLAMSDTELLLTGETGVGKEVYARAVHTVSARPGRFVALNCAAIPRDLLESELFGFRAGAHSMASAGKVGLLEEADRGTLFLDEIGDMAPDAQTKLLRFLQDKELTPLGATRPRRLDVRIIAATNRAVAPGDGQSPLRDDLLARLGAAPLVLPPLRARCEDVGALAQHFLARVSRQAPLGFDVPAVRALMLYNWPLNVRELEKVVAAAVALAGPTRPVGVADLPLALVTAPSGRRSEARSLPAEGGMPAAATPAVPSSRKPPEAAPSPDALEALLREHHGNVADVSRALGRQRAAVWRWIKKFGLGPDKYRIS